MLFPTADQYSEFIEKKGTSTFYVLKDYFFHTSGQGQDAYIFKKGDSSVIFKAEKNGEKFGIRCFLNADPDTFKRYDPVCRYLSSKKLPLMASCDFLEKEIRLNGEQYPVLKMEWVEGQQLNEFIDQIVSDPARLSKLQYDLVGLSSSLEENCIGHGDLNFSHIMISGDVTDFTIRLVDYDSLYIKEFQGQNSLISGSPGFQHPVRLASDFSETIDRFSIWVMITGLEAIKHDPRLWTQPEQMGYNKSENLLFTFRDLVSPERSRLFQQLKTTGSESLQFYINHLETFCEAHNLDSIIKPELYKAIARPFSLQEIKLPATTEAFSEKLFNVEIKTIPSGRDVLVNGMKKGITPLRIALTKKDFTHVEVMNAYEKTPLEISEQVQTYEIDFLKKQKEGSTQSTLTEQDEILEFGADRYTAREGELVAIRWKVRGNAKIHIDPIGDVREKNGSREFVVKKTTQYVLSLGTKKRSFTVHVQTGPEKKFLRSKMQTPPEGVTTNNSRKKTKLVLWLISILVAAAGIYFLINYFSKDNSEKTTNQTIPQSKPAPVTQFTAATVTGFLDQLYSAYNQRNLPHIMDQYAGTVKEYYDSKSITTDSLSAIIRDLFITPAFYQCRPDYSTLKISPSDQTCSFVVSIREILQKESGSRKDTFTTKIAYVIDRDLHIISEKGADE